MNGAKFEFQRATGVDQRGRGGKNEWRTFANRNAATEKRERIMAWARLINRKGSPSFLIKTRSCRGVDLSYGEGIRNLSVVKTSVRR